MKVLKFGGTSLGSPERMKQVGQLAQINAPIVLVLSAVSGTTNTLVDISASLRRKDYAGTDTQLKALEDKYAAYVLGLFDSTELKTKAEKFLAEKWQFLSDFKEQEFSAKIEKTVLAQGELISTQLMKWHLDEKEVSTVLVSSLDFMETMLGEPNYPVIEKKLSDFLLTHQKASIIICQGFICKNEKGEIDNLKRGGSDYSASIIGAAIDAEEIQIWTDIDGMHNNDPRVVTPTFPVHELSFDEAAELAYFGAKILHPSSILPAKMKGIPVKLLNTLQPDAQGTLIHHFSVQNNKIKAVAAKDNITAIRIRSGRMLLAYGFLKKVFEVFEKYRTSIDVITTSEVAVSLTIDDESYLPEITEDLQSFGEVTIDRGLSIVCVVGHFIQENSALVSQIFASIKDIPVRMISFGGSRSNISFLIKTDFKTDVLNALNHGLFKEQIDALLP